MARNSLHIELLTLSIERGAVDSEHFGGFAEVGGSFDDPAKVEFIQLLGRDGRAGSTSHVINFVLLIRRFAQLHGKVAGNDAIASGHDYRSFDGIAQLAQISGPGIIEETREGVVGKLFDGPCALSS